MESLPVVPVDPVTLAKKKVIVSQKWKKCSSSTTTATLGWSSRCFNCPSGNLAGFVGVTVLALVVASAQGYNDEKGILKWNPYWFSNFRYSAPSSFYISPNRIGAPLKRFIGDSMSGSGIYKWSPVYFSGGNSGLSTSASQLPTSGLAGSGFGANGYMYSASRPRWSGPDYGSSRFLTRYYGGNSFVPMSPRSSYSSGTGLTGNSGIQELAGNNDLSAILGEELMMNGLGLENDAIDILDGERPPTPRQQDQKD